jgi:transposase
MWMIYLGVDVSKHEFHAAVLDDNDRAARHSFPNNARGHEQLLKWLKNRRIETSHACLEATGGLGEELAITLSDNGHVVSIVNPARIKAFGESEGIRTKTDTVDAALIARFCRAQSPDRWTPPSAKERALQALLRRRENLIEMRTQELNRGQAALVTDSVQSSIEDHIGFLNDRITELEEEIRRLIDSDSDLRGKRELLTSIPGIGETTANAILGEMPNLGEFRDVKAVAAHAGLSPKHNQSGLSPGRSRLCKAGNARLRKALYFPALVAMKKNPVLVAFAQRLRERGKREMVIVAAVMRKLLTIAYGVLKGGRPFSPSKA